MTFNLGMTVNLYISISILSLLTLERIARVTGPVATAARWVVALVKGLFSFVVV